MFWVDKAAWIEVALTVTPELAEAVAEVLGRFTREGVVIEQLADQNTHQEKTILNPEVRVYGYFFNDETVGDRKKRVDEAFWYLSRIQPLPPAQYREIHDQDWMEAWKKHYEPITIGKKLVILPAWIEKKYPGRLPIRINPGMAFGTGTHPTTQLCLEFLEELVKPEMTVFDIGCGSGILSAGAVILGAGSVVAVDIDPASVRSTTENCELNKVSDKVAIERGSAELIRCGHFDTLQAPLVVANILASVILVLLEERLADLVEPGGHLVLSGILAHQAQEIIQAANEQGLILNEIKQIEDWNAIDLIKE
jgi:ribosomal protein L11 methyltransferase